MPHLPTFLRDIVAPIYTRAQVSHFFETGPVDLECFHGSMFERPQKHSEEQWNQSIIELEAHGVDNTITGEGKI